jgi:hypothetical protein
MDAINPYASPAELPTELSASTGRKWCALAGCVLSLIVPVGIAWEELIGRIVISTIHVNIAVTLAVFALTLLSVPLGYIGLRSCWWKCGVVALVSGSVFSLWMFKIKFYPVLWN